MRGALVFAPQSEAEPISVLPKYASCCAKILRSNTQSYQLSYQLSTTLLYTRLLQLRNSNHSHFNSTMARQKQQVRKSNGMLPATMTARERAARLGGKGGKGGKGSRKQPAVVRKPHHWKPGSTYNLYLIIAC